MKRSLLNKLILVLVLVFLAGAVSACGVPGSSTQTTEAPTDEVTTEAPTDEATTEAPTEAPGPEIAEDSPLATLPEYTYDTYKALWDVENGAEILLYTADNSDGYNSYLTELEGAGFTKYAENEIVGNLYSTWTNDDLHVTMMYIPSQKSVRILAEPSTLGLPTRAEDNVYTDAGVENVVVQVGTNYDGQQGNGMCYIYRLCDGSFILVDSGFNSTQCADAIYNTLVKLAPDPENIVIAAWFITHQHGDHVGGIYSFATKYAEKVSVEQIIYNYPTEKVFKLCDSGLSHITKLPEHAAMFEGCELVEAHPGQEFYIRDAYIEMLYTWDMFTSSVLLFMNNTSLVFSVEINDTKMMMLGDCGPLASPIVTNAYGDYIKSDYIQVAHHGYVGATVELNTLIDADVIMWPAAESTYMSHLADACHEMFRGAENLYIADSSATQIPIPFDKEKVEIWDLYGLGE